MADLDLTRIKRNVTKMAAQNAPVEDIDGYIASEGTSVDAVRAFQMPTAAPAAAAPPAASLAAGGGYGGQDVNGRTGSTFLGAMDGMSFGLADEIGAGINTAVDAGRSYITGQPAKGYDEWLGKLRGLQDNAQEQHPGYYLGGQVGGGAAQAAAIAGAGGAPLLGMAGETIPERVLAAGFSGGGFGAAHGFGSGEGGIGNRAIEAAKEAGGGFVGGIVALPAGKAIGAGLNAATKYLASRGQPVTAAVRDYLATAMQRDGLTAEQAVQRLSQLGPDAMLADVSPSLRERAGQIARSDTPAANEVFGAVRDRTANAGQRVTGAFDEALGQRPNVKAELDRMTGEQKTKADALYGQARTENAPVDVLPVLKAIDDQLMTPAERIAGPSGLPDDPVDTQLRWARAHLTNGDVQATGIDKLDKLERRIRSRARVAFKTGRSDEGSALANVGRVLRDQMKGSSAAYKAAREGFSDDAAVQDAFETGQNLFGRKVHPDFLAAEVADMSEAERQALRLGARAAVDQAMGSVRNGTVKGRQLLESDWNARKLATVLGDDEGAALAGRLQSEGAMADTADRVLSAPLRDDPLGVRPSSAEDAPGMVRSVLNLKAGDAAARGAGYVSDLFKRRGTASLAEGAGDILTATGGDRDRKVNAVVEALGLDRQMAADARKRRAVIEALTAGGVGAGARERGRALIP